MTNLRPKTGNYYYGARYYDPKTGIWLSVDPLAMHPQQMDKSPYAFSWNNPVRYVDPDGRCPECEENVENPEVGETYESSGGRTYQYQNTYDEDGNKMGAAWTGLGGKLAEVEVEPGADNAGAQVGGNSSLALDIGGGIYGGLQGLTSSQGHWLGKNGKYYSNNWGGNQYTGSRSGAFKVANQVQNGW